MKNIKQNPMSFRLSVVRGKFLKLSSISGFDKFQAFRQDTQIIQNIISDTNRASKIYSIKAKCELNVKSMYS